MLFAHSPRVPGKEVFIGGILQSLDTMHEISGEPKREYTVSIVRADSSIIE